jgi:hypothetical protein
MMSSHGLPVSVLPAQHRIFAAVQILRYGGATFSNKCSRTHTFAAVPILRYEGATFAAKICALEHFLSCVKRTLYIRVLTLDHPWVVELFGNVCHARKKVIFEHTKESAENDAAGLRKPSVPYLLVSDNL